MMADWINITDNITGVSGVVCHNSSSEIQCVGIRAPVGHEAAAWAHTLRYVCEVGLVLPIALLGILGNVIAFFVLCNHKHKTTTTVLLKALAIVDTLILATSLLLRTFRHVIPGYDRTLSFTYMFRWMYPIVFVLRLGDTWLTVLLTVDRFIAVCHPLHAQRLCTFTRTYILMGLLGVASLLLSLPRFFEYKLYEDKGMVGIKGGALVTNKVYIWAHSVIFYQVIMYLVPMILMIVLNACLLTTLRNTATFRGALQEKPIYTKTFRARSLMDSQGTTSVNQGEDRSLTMVCHGVGRSNRSITLIVTTVVLVCVLCNVSGMITHIIQSLHKGLPNLKHLDLGRRICINITNVLITTNSAVNFVIYCVCSRNFRSVVRTSCIDRIIRAWKSCFFKTPSQTSIEVKYTSGNSSSSYSSRMPCCEGRRKNAVDINLHALPGQRHTVIKANSTTDNECCANMIDTLNTETP